MCPSQLIQGEDVIIYQSLGRGRLFCQSQKREGMRVWKREKQSKDGSAFSLQPTIWLTSVTPKRIRPGFLEIICSSNVSETCILWLHKWGRDSSFNFFIIWSFAHQLSKHVQLEDVRLMPGFHHFETLFCPSFSLSLTSPPSSLIRPRLKES